MESKSNFDIATFLPDDFACCPFMEGWFYAWGDFTVGTDGLIYECWDIEYCNEDPTTELGSYGWGRADLYTTAALPDYNPDTCVAKKNYVAFGTSAEMSTAFNFVPNVPYFTGDMIIHNAGGNNN